MTDFMSNIFTIFEKNGYNEDEIIKELEEIYKKRLIENESFKKSLVENDALLVYNRGYSFLEMLVEHEMINLIDFYIKLEIPKENTKQGFILACKKGHEEIIFTIFNSGKLYKKNLLLGLSKLINLDSNETEGTEGIKKKKGIALNIIRLLLGKEEDEDKDQEDKNLKSNTGLKFIAECENKNDEQKNIFTILYSGKLYKKDLLLGLSKLINLDSNYIKKNIFLDIIELILGKDEDVEEEEEIFVARNDETDYDYNSASFGKLKKTQFYCLKCKKIVNNNKNKTKIVKLKNGKHSLTSKCNECDKKLFKFVKEKDVKNYESKYGKSKIYKSKGKKRSKK
jgi:hypothetical protein